MSATAEAVSSVPDELELLTFTVSGITMGVDTDQVAEMMKPAQADTLEVKTQMLHDALSFINRPAEYGDPIVLVLKDATAQRGIIVDGADAIASVPFHALRPLPALLEKCAAPGAVWGFAVKDSEVIVLIDLYKLPAAESMRE